MRIDGGVARSKTADVERILNIHIEKLPEGFYLATSDDVQGLVAQGRTIAKTLEIARGVARKLIEEHAGTIAPVTLAPAQDAFDYPLVISV